MRIVDYVILAVIVVLLVLAIRYSLKHRHECCGNCSGCAACKSCNRKNKK